MNAALRRIGSPLGRSSLLRHLLIALVAAGLLLLLTEHLGEYRNSQVATVAYEFCAIAGLTVLTGLSGQISLGNGAFMFVGAYTVALLLEHHPHTDNSELVLVMLAAIGVAAVIGGLVGVAAARLRGPYLAGVTLALALGLPELPKYQHLEGPLGGHTGLVVNAPLAPHDINFSRWQAWICCLAAVLTWLLLQNLISSRVGRAFRAVRDDEVAASLSGMSVARIQVLAFVVSAASAGLAGGLLALIFGQVGPDSFGLQISLFLLAAAVFGGLGSLAGAAYGAVLITFLPNWAMDVANAVSLPAKVSNNLQIFLYGLVLVVAMLVFPLGLQGLFRRWWFGARARLGARNALAR
ncbi:MAG TPA: branched-chain amino acid ABC transporter permease [Mycobacteriales bacterium]|nr:branched-chain amino acid ABC transporter permease [Mycobacteriales bacterium]